MANEEGTFGGLLTRMSMRRPISILVLVLSLVLAALFSLKLMRRDILPDINIPTIYVAQSYGGMTPSQMESYITASYEQVFLFVSGVEHVESKSVQSIAVLKLQFYPGTDMGQALAEVNSYVNRVRAIMPPGTVPPFIVRFGTSNLPIGDLVFASEGRSLAELQNYAMTQVRPLFTSLPGVSASAPFGANAKAVVISMDAAKLRRFDVSAEDVVQALAQGNLVSPAGNISAAGLYPMVALNSVVKSIQGLADLPLRLGNDRNVYLGDVATVGMGADIQTGYALVNGRRTIYIPVTKQEQASTLTVVEEVKAALPRFQAVLPPDVKVSFAFDQSGYVRNAINSLVVEAVLGALLTGLMVLLFLRDWRSALIVVLNIPLAVLGAIIALKLTGQTVNIMTLGGLALAIGVLVDETTVTIENIHTHMLAGSSVPRAALEATRELFIPKLFILLAFLVVFTPAIFMTGIPGALFVPLALAVGSTLIVSFLLSATVVPVLAAYLLKHHPGAAKAAPKNAPPIGFAAFKKRYVETLAKLLPRRRLAVASYLTLSALLVGSLWLGLGRDIFPTVDEGQFQVRFRAPTGTALARTEAIVLRALEIIKADVGGADKVSTSVVYVGAQSYNYPINSIYLWTSGPQDAVLNVALEPGSGVRLAELRETLRRDFAKQLSGTAVSFEPSSLVDRAMSGGSSTPIEVAVSGFDLALVRQYADKILEGLRGVPQLRDLQYGQALGYPVWDVNVDRRKAGASGVNLQRVSQALVPATSSSRFLVPVFWGDPQLGTSFQIQAQFMSGTVKEMADLHRLPVSLGGASIPLGSVATVTTSTAMGEIDRYSSQRTMSLTANFQGIDLGRATKLVQQVLKKLEAEKPRGVSVRLRGQSQPMVAMFKELGLGLLLALVAILLLLAVNFESFSLAWVVFSTAPAVVAGGGLALWLTGSTLNIESYMGIIMAVGVAFANSILLVTFAERDRLRHGDSVRAAVEGAQSRLRPILMTSLAMGAGMLPMAFGLTEGGQLAAPLGRAVVGGLAVATLSTLFILPLVFAMVQAKRSTNSPSLDPDDPGSTHFEEV